jgi:hypothetical protein
MNTETVVRSGTRTSRVSDRKPKERLIRLSAALKKLPNGEQVEPVQWAGIQPWFRRQGLKTVEDVITGKRTVIYREHAGWGAVEEFFDLTSVLAYMLFSRRMVNGRSPEEVANRIDTLIRRLVS